jgi:hypothetical protein
LSTIDFIGLKVKKAGQAIEEKRLRKNAISYGNMRQGVSGNGTV